MYTVGRTEIYACGDNVSHQCVSESAMRLSAKQEAPSSVGGSTFTHKKTVNFSGADGFSISASKTEGKELFTKKVIFYYI